MKKESYAPKVTVYIANYNYLRFLNEAIQSILAQNFSNWELIIILDGAVDNSEQLSFEYAKRYPNKIKVLKNSQRQGLQHSANKAIANANGEYIIRLDPDDYLNESAFRLLSTYLDDHQEVSMVYSDYFYISSDGDILDIDERKKLGHEDSAFDLPAHGACAMYRTEVLKKYGGYSEEFNAQDGYDVWYKFLEKKEIANIKTPLFYYRQHKSSLSQNSERILKQRQKIKRHYAERAKQKFNKIAFVIGAKKDFHAHKNILDHKIFSHTLFEHTLHQARNLRKEGSNIIISTDNPNLKNYLNEDEILHIRNTSLNDDYATVDDVIFDATKQLEEKFNYFPDVIVFLNCLTPLRSAENVQEGIDTLLLHKFDSVISVYEDFDLHFFHSTTGLEPISKRRHMELRIEREALYVDNRSFLVSLRKGITKSSSRGSRIGHVVMDRDMSDRITSPQDLSKIKMKLQ